MNIIILQKLISVDFEPRFGCFAGGFMGVINFKNILDFSIVYKSHINFISISYWVLINDFITLFIINFYIICTPFGA